MSVKNISRQFINEFVFGGFDTVQNPQIVGVILLIFYILLMISNTANILFIIMDKRLHQPMYIFICNLALVDMVYSTSSCPTMISNLVVGYKKMSYAPCIEQMYVFHTSGIMEAFAISVMAFDRFIAIGSPLQYHSFLTNVRCFLIIIALWLAAFALLAVLPASVIPLQVCSSAVKYMFCDYATVVRATCVDPEPYFNRASLLTSVLSFGTFGLICLSYLRIIIVVVRMPSKTDKKKAFNTCFSHLIVIFCYYAPTVTRIVLTRIGVVLSIEVRNGLMVGSIVGPPLVNPFLYGFRSKEIRSKIFKIIPQAKSAKQNQHKV